MSYTNNKGFVLQPNGDQYDVKPDHGRIYSEGKKQEICGGFIEHIYLTGGWAIVANVDGEDKKLPYNPFASDLCESGKDPQRPSSKIYGTVLVAPISQLF